MADPKALAAQIQALKAKLPTHEDIRQIEGICKSLVRTGEEAEERILEHMRDGDTLDPFLVLVVILGHAAQRMRGETIHECNRIHEALQKLRHSD
jgi:hypothetical protein